MTRSIKKIPMRGPAAKIHHAAEKVPVRSTDHPITNGAIIDASWNIKFEVPFAVAAHFVPANCEIKIVSCGFARYEQKAKTNAKTESPNQLV